MKEPRIINKFAQLAKRAIREAAASHDGQKCRAVFISDRMYWMLGEKLLAHAPDVHNGAYRLINDDYDGLVVIDGLLRGTACYTRA